MKIRTYLVALAALAFGSTARADEGMWLLQLMKQQNSIELQAFIKPNTTKITP